MKKIYIIISLIIISSTSQIVAQAGWTSLQYSIGFASGDFKDYISEPSFRGITFDWRKMVNEKIGVGIDIGWNVFNETKDYASYTNGTETITGIQYRFVSAVPGLVTVDYFLKPSQDVSPFIGLGVGTQYTRNDLDMGVYTSYVDAWHFAIKPELGVIFKANPDFGLVVVAKYYNAFKTSDIGGRSYIATNIGFVWEY